MHDTVTTNRRPVSRSLRITCASALLFVLCLSMTAAEGAAQEYFRSPEAAFKALLDAVKKDDHARLQAILGPDSGNVVSSGDEVADRAAGQQFVARAKQETKLVKSGDAAMIAHVGKDDWSFPIPLAKDSNGWCFDTAAGKEELLNRRIGRNELHTIAVCYAYVDAQREYAREDRNGDGIRQYAQKFGSDPGRRNGLYWEVTTREPPSPMGPLVADATQAGYTVEAGTGPRPFYGYLFKILTAQGTHAPEGARQYIVGGHMTGGFGLVAYPAHYGASGIMTFVVNQNGIVFQKNLGEKTGEIAAAMTEYDPDDSWQPIGRDVVPASEHWRDSQ